MLKYNKINKKIGGRGKMINVNAFTNNNLVDYISLFKTLPKAVQKHCIRVSVYSYIIYQEACKAKIYEDESLDEKYLPYIIEGVLYHDLGLIFLEESFINKICATNFDIKSLSADEKENMQKHASLSADLFEGFLEQDVALPNIFISIDAGLGHHEKWDGSGYPNKCCGEDISIVARVVSLANFYDNYFAQSHEQGVLAIEKESGLSFDPKLVEVFLKCQEKIKQEKMRFDIFNKET